MFGVRYYESRYYWIGHLAQQTNEENKTELTKEVFPGIASKLLEIVFLGHLYTINMEMKKSTHLLKSLSRHLRTMFV